MNLPNKLTVIRLIIIPFFLLLMVLPLQSWGAVSFWGATIPMAQLIAAILFIAATITDNLDGQIARRHHLVTNFGKFTDPLADKLLVIYRFDWKWCCSIMGHFNHYLARIICYGLTLIISGTRRGSISR